jgi:hypothetical protein
MLKQRLLLTILAMNLAGLAFGSSGAQAAIHLTADGALSFNTDNYGFVSNPSPLVAFELTFGLSDLIQYGFVYDHNFLSYSGGGNGSLNFYGGIVRLGFFDGFFVDGQAGIDNRDSVGTSFSWGVGAGFTYGLSPFIDVGPRVSYRFVPDSGVERSMFDAGVFFTLKLL